MSSSSTEAAAVLGKRFYDPVRRAVVSVEEYATGPSNGNPAVPLGDAVHDAANRIDAQLRANATRMTELSQFESSLRENESVVTLKHRQAVAHMRSRVGELIAALHRLEADLLAEHTAQHESVAKPLRRQAAETHAQLEALTAATNVLQRHVNSSSSSATRKTSGSRASPGAAADEADGGAETTLTNEMVLCALDQSAAIVEETSIGYECPATAPQPVTTSFGEDETDAMVRRLMEFNVQQYELSYAPATLWRKPEGSTGDRIDKAPTARRSTSPSTNTAEQKPHAPLVETVVAALPAKTPRSLPFAPGLLHALSVSPSKGFRNLLDGSSDEGGCGFDIVPSVPVTTGHLQALCSDYLFVKGAPTTTLTTFRTASVKGAMLWWDFGVNRRAKVQAYALAHGGPSQGCALRSWRLLGASETPPAFPATEIVDEEGRAAVTNALDSFVAQHCHIIDRRLRDAHLGKAAYDTWLYSCSSPNNAGHRFVGIQITDSNAAGKDHFQIQIAGAEFYGAVAERTQD